MKGMKDSRRRAKEVTATSSDSEWRLGLRIYPAATGITDEG